MKIIAHRGNIGGPIPILENSPKYLAAALLAGFDVEVDVWSTPHGFFLGHDNAIFPISLDFLRLPQVWCHAKTVETALHLDEIGCHTFVQEDDVAVFTNRGVLIQHCDSRALNHP
jgi:hypothetical protein